MNLDVIKGIVFRHGEKIVLGIVILFVAYNVLAFFSPDEVGDGGLGGVPVPGDEAKTSEAIEPAFLRAAVPYLDDLTVQSLPRDPFFPPQTIVLPPVTELQEEKTLRTTRQAPTSIIGEPQEMPLTAAEMPAEGLSGPPAQVRAFVDPNQRDTIVFEAQKAGHWIAYEAMLANENKCRVLVRVARPEEEIRDIVLAPEVTSCEEEQLGVVVLRFTQPPPPKTASSAEGRIVKQYHVPTEFRVYRQSEYDEARALIERMPVEGGERRAPRPSPRRPAEPPEGYPGGYPGAPAYGPPRRAPGEPTPEMIAEGLAPAPKAPRRPAAPAPKAGTAREREPVQPTQAGEHVFADRSVQSEVTYKYWVQAAAVIPAEVEGQEAIEVTSEEVGPLEVRTKQRFTFAYVGGTYKEARIVVFIGPREKPVAYKTFTVPVGGRIGELPARERPSPEPPAVEEPPAPRAEREAPEAPRFVTGFVLVDLIPDAFRLVAQVKTVPKRDEQGRVVRDDAGHIVHARVTVYREDLARQAILRDRQERLVRLWYERPSKVLPDKAGGSSSPRRPSRPGRRR